MLGRNKRARNDQGESSTTQPLLNGSQEDLHDNSDVLFKVEDEDEDDYVEASALGNAESPTSKQKHNVRFQEEVQVWAPPLRSTTDSRETGE